MKTNVQSTSLETLLGDRRMAVSECPLGPEYDGSGCDSNDCGPCQIEHSDWKNGRPADELPEPEYYGG